MDCFSTDYMASHVSWKPQPGYFPCTIQMYCPLLDLWRRWYVPAFLAKLLSSILNILSILKKLKTDSKGFQVSLWKDDILQYIQKYSENTYDFIYKTRSQQITRITWLWIFNKLSMHSWNLKNIKKCTEKSSVKKDNSYS